MRPTTKSSRNGIIDFMKFMFIILVMLFHTGKLAPGGYIAVDFFFIVSGFLMAKSMEKQLNSPRPLGADTLSFVLHKAKGIFPAYITCWMFTFITKQWLSHASFTGMLLELFRSPFNIFMLEMAGNYDMGHRIQGSWYISAMLLAMLFLYPIRKKYTNIFDCVVAPILTLVFIGHVYQNKAGISYTVKYIPQLLIYNGLWKGITEISLGCFCYYLTNLLNRLNFTTLGKTLISLAELGGYGIVFLFAFVTGRTDKDLVLLLILAFVIILSFSQKGILSGLFNRQLFYFLGNYSLYLYLTHECIKNVVFPYLKKHIVFANFLSSSLSNYLLTYLSFVFVISLLVMQVTFFLEKVWSAKKNQLKDLIILP